MFNLDTLTPERKENAINSIIGMTTDKANKTKAVLKSNMTALKIVINGEDTSELKKEISELSVSNAKKVLKFINSIFLGLNNYSQNVAWDELATRFPESGMIQN